MFTEKQIKAFHKLETPFYFYDLDLLRNTLDRLKKESDKARYHIHYAIKANANPKILRLVSSYGFGADCVSGNEIKAALENGFRSDKVAFAGVGKTDQEITFAIKNNIFSLNCESLPELEVIGEIAAKEGKKAKIALRINPNLNPNTHHYITTGLEENKFGINLWELETIIKYIKGNNHLELTGLHFHLGSQITDLSVFRSLCMKVNYIQNQLFKKQIRLPHLNLGGGLGIDYNQPDKNSIPDFGLFFNIFRKFLEPMPGQTIHFEPGRTVTGQCGSLISRVLFVKKGVTTDFAILDAGMTELIRPALYQAYHKIENLTAPVTENFKKYDVVGPICESSDCFGKSIELPETKRGDFIAIRSTGAYGEVMSSSYNLRDRAKSIFSDEL
ncbi:MAG: diaminopimelate decarboxylase [Deltaproteobacteria bacterium]